MRKSLLSVPLITLGILTGMPFYGENIMAKNTPETQEIIPATAQPSMNGPAEWFTGTVTVRPIFGPKHPEAPFGAAYVTFAAGARSHWHTHPAGQHLIVTEGVGLTGTADGKVATFAAGDALWCPKDIKHWHGASPSASMTHIALTGTLPDGKNVDWMEPVTDEQYTGGK